MSVRHSSNIPTLLHLLGFVDSIWYYNHHPISCHHSGKYIVMCGNNSSLVMTITLLMVLHMNNEE